MDSELGLSMSLEHNPNKYFAGEPPSEDRKDMFHSLYKISTLIFHL